MFSSLATSETLLQMHILCHPATRAFRFLLGGVKRGSGCSQGYFAPGNKKMFLNNQVKNIFYFIFTSSTLILRLQHLFHTVKSPMKHYKWNLVQPDPYTLINTLFERIIARTASNLHNYFIHIRSTTRITLTSFLSLSRTISIISLPTV